MVGWATPTPPNPLFSKEGVPKAGAFDDDIRRINVFDWKKEFPEIMKNGGFDAVIGNPPYVLLQTLDQPAISKYLANIYLIQINKRYPIDV
mgnify:CR=1 FL=1